MRHRPSQYGYLPDGDTKAETYESANSSSLYSSDKTVEPPSGSQVAAFTARAAVRTRAFWYLSFSFFFHQMGLSAIMVHIVPYLESVNIPTTIAATAVTGMTLCSIIGRLGFGFLGDFTSKRYLITVAIFLQTIGLIIFSLIDADRTWLIIPFMLIYAPGYGGPIPLRAALQADYFGTKNLGAIMGLMAVASMGAGLASPVIAGWIFDEMGSYQLAWQIFAITTVPAIVLMLLAKPPRQEPAIA